MYKNVLVSLVSYLCYLRTLSVAKVM